MNIVNDYSGVKLATSMTTTCRKSPTVPLTLKRAKAIIVALTHGSKQSAVTSEPLSLWLRNCHHLIRDVIVNEMICRVLPYTETQGQNSP